MRFSSSLRRKISLVLLGIWITNILLPSVTYGLTSGPAQPETASFQLAGVSNMVDLFTGDFKYNIPLADVDGYPINLNYDSGSGMDDEASWTGLGWNLNVGAVNRQLRGIPDDMSGDEIRTEHYTKPKITVGGKLTGKIEVKGKGVLKEKANAMGSFTLGVFSDNYTGIGAEVGANVGISFSLANGGALTAGMGAGVISNTASGVDVSPYVSLALKSVVDEKTTVNSGLSSSLGYNTRSGLKNLTLGSSFSISHPNKIKDAVSGSSGYNMGGSLISFNTEPLSPKIQIPYRSVYESYSFDFGGVAWAVFLSGGGTGYKSVRTVARTNFSNPEFGFLYAERGKHKEDAIMDFTREKENPIIPELPNLALPVHTPDLFSYTSQGGSGQFRLYRGGTGAFFDNKASDESEVFTAGLDLGTGAYFHGGVTLFEQATSNVTRKWQGSSNSYLKKGDFQDYSTNPDREHVYFKQVGEKNAEDKSMSGLVYSAEPLSVDIVGKYTNLLFRANTNYVRGTLPVYDLIKKQRQVKRTSISYLTSAQASKAALDKEIKSYAFNDAATFTPAPNNQLPLQETSNRISQVRKGHHISELTVTDDGGKRAIYGIPVYNTKQEEHSFAVGRKGSDYLVINNNQVAFSETAGSKPDHFKGIDHYYHKESQPAYASSFLLTGILSPDYSDKTGDGITADDAGTGIKFNYSKLPYLYKWRTPYQNAALNKSLLADPDDDKASIVYGEKEIWYTHSIETKTKIAYFITEDREDGLGVLNWKGGQDASQKLKRLKEIRVYSKSDLKRPIKVVKFEYSYELCPGVPNSVAGGKLTLKKVYFQYGNTDKGKYHPYIFSYKTSLSDSSAPVAYGYMQTDRWGVYKPEAQSTSAFTNEEYPYSVQNKIEADENAAVWNLEKIELPTGGIIRVNYESDDYAYVQNKKAMEMVKVESLLGSNLQDIDSVSLKEAVGIRLKIDVDAPQGVQTKWFRKNYLGGSDYLYTKLMVKLSTEYAQSYGCDYEFIPVHCRVKSVTIDGNDAKVRFEPISEGNVTVNPIILAAWQRLKNEYPRYAYLGFENRVKDGDAGKAIKAAITAIISAVRTLDELKENFYEKADSKNFAGTVDLEKSFVRMDKTDGFKLGGGVRVKKIRISDDWTAMSESTNDVDAAYGQAYEYSTLENGKTISSGVAAYEPYIGSDENPLKQPVPYTQKIKGAINNFFSLETPFGESFFPAPTVGYSKVTIRNLDAGGEPDADNETGFTVNEFYTAREFPVKVEILPMIRNDHRPNNIFSFIGASSVHELTLSQGYKIELNDMHGKPKAERVFNQSGAEISSVEYFYNDNKGAQEKRLRNITKIVHPDGSVEDNAVIGRDIEFFTDFREQESINRGKSVNIGGDVFPIIFGIPFLLPHWPSGDNNDYRLFRSACAVKVVQYYGVIDKVVKTQNGSSVTTENVAYDAITGDPLITKTQNEFNKDIYSVNLPAYWVYDGMGAAYKTIGLILKDISTNSSGVISGSYSTYLKAGDELADLSSGELFWVTEGPVKKLINREGAFQFGKNIASAKVIRSGLRNLLQSNTMSVVCLQNPISSGRLMLTSGSDIASFKVINASATLFDQSWAAEPETGGNTPGNQRYLIENTSQPFSFGPGNAIYSKGAYLDFVNANNPGSLTVSGYWGNGSSSAGSGPFVRSSIWPAHQGSVSGNEAESLSIDTCITIPQDKYYYVGAGSSGQISYSFDNSANGNSFAAFENRWVVGKHFLKAGKHRLTVTVYVNDNNPSDDYAGLEIYNNSLEELKNTDDSGAGINVLFSTGGIRNKADIKSSRSRYLSGAMSSTVYHYTEANGAAPDPCYNYVPAPVKRKVNPYVNGYLGNWRVVQTKVFEEKRSYGNIFSASLKGIGVKDAGYISNFYSFWHNPSPSQPLWQANTAGIKWVTANTVTLYDQYGQELENRDALGRFSAALFDFKGELPAAVASNARNREIHVNSFEDSKAVSPADALVREFAVAETNDPIRVFAVNHESHTGNYSVQIPVQGLTLSTTIHNNDHRAEPYLEQVPSQGYMTKDIKGLYPVGFEPYPGKKYVFNAWVKDGHPLDATLKLTLKAYNINIPLKCKAVIEGWKLVEGEFKTPAATGNFDLALIPAGTSVFIDDIRIYPFDAHLKSYSYDEKTFKLMAELDENGFATLYEYDDEGTLVRVKKETERGVVTIKETRSSYKKRVQ